MDGHGHGHVLRDADKDGHEGVDGDRTPTN